MRPGWFPHFVHVLKISPKSTYEINLNSVWSGIGSLQSNLMNAQQVGYRGTPAVRTVVIVDRNATRFRRMASCTPACYCTVCADLCDDKIPCHLKQETRLRVQALETKVDLNGQPRANRPQYPSQLPTAN